MGTYTTNYQLYLPSIGEQGWGDLVNANFTKLDIILNSGEGIRSAQADKLTTARTINGTAFDGTANITTANWGTARTINGSSINGSANVTTANWGTARNFTITDGTNTGIATSVNGSENVSLKLPTNINVTTSNATNASKLMQYMPPSSLLAEYRLVMLQYPNAWIPEYSGTVSIYTPSTSIWLLCNGSKYMALASNGPVVFTVVAGASYTLPQSTVVIQIYGIVAYR